MYLIAYKHVLLCIGITYMKLCFMSGLTFQLHGKPKMTCEIAVKSAANMTALCIKGSSMTLIIVIIFLTIKKGFFSGVSATILHDNLKPKSQPISSYTTSLNK